jgi:hypothetical protein
VFLLFLPLEKCNKIITKTTSTQGALSQANVAHNKNPGFREKSGVVRGI